MAQVTPPSEIQIVLPMAGLGTRFTEAGYQTPKPLLPIHGVPMFKIVLGNIFSNKVSKVVVITRREWDLTGEIDQLAKSTNTKFRIVEIDYTTDGPASTVMLAQDLLDPDKPVVVANSDQYVNTSIETFYEKLVTSDAVGCIMTMNDKDPKWSFVKLDDQGHVSEVREKEVISNEATVGIYGFKKAQHMIDAINEMREANDRINAEFYVAPAYNYLIASGQAIDVFNTGDVRDVMFGLGIPRDYEFFVECPESQKAAESAIIFFGRPSRRDAIRLNSNSKNLSTENRKTQ